MTAVRFLTPDPYMASGGPADPGSWNRYVYVQWDPVNFYDPSGNNMAMPGPEPEGGGGGGGGFWPGVIGAIIGIITGGGGSTPTPDGFIPSKTWETNPGLAVKLWDAAIAATVAQAFEDTDIRYPLYLNVADECVTKNFTGALELRRHYELEDQLGRDMPGGTFTEFNAVVAGEATSKNATFRGNDWDYISAGYQGRYNFYQTFVGRSGTGIGPVPIFVQDHGVDYGTLAVETTRTSIKINGVDKSNVRPCP